MILPNMEKLFEGKVVTAAVHESQFPLLEPRTCGFCIRALIDPVLNE